MILQVDLDRSGHRFWQGSFRVEGVAPLRIPGGLLALSLLLVELRAHLEV